MKQKEFWINRNVFVTGATGFIGSWITKTLIERGASVTILVRDICPKPILESAKNVYSKLRGIILGDVVDYKVIERILNEYEIDTCFHLAAQTLVGTAKRSPLSTFETNIKGTWNVLEASRNSQTVHRIVLASSDKVYGEPIKLPITEDHALLASYPYEASKACADILARSYFQTYSLCVAVTRCSNVYGGGDLNFSRIVPDTIRSVLLDKNPIIRSDGTPVRDYMYVSDAVNAYLTLAENLERSAVKGEAFNFGTNKPISVLDLVRKIIELSGKRNLNAVILGKAIKEIEKEYLSSEKAKTTLNWKPKVSLDQGLVETINWYKENMGLWMPYTGM
jgi:CDP-glucose 4,6-dehydratase